MKDVKSLQREQSPSPSLRSGAAGGGGESSAPGGEGLTRTPSEGGIVRGRAQGRNLQRSPSSDKRQRPAGGVVQRRQEGGIIQGRSPPGGEISRSSSASTAPVAMGGAAAAAAAAAGGLRRGGIARSSSSRSPPPPAVRGRGVGVPLELMRAPPPARHPPPNPSLPTAAHSRAPPVLPPAAPLVTRLGDLTSPASNVSAQEAVVGVPVQSITAAATVAAPPSSSHPPVRPPPASPEGAVAKAANLLRRIGSWKSALSPGGPSSTPERTNSVSGSEPRATNPPPFTPTGAGLPQKGSSDEVEDRGAEARPVPTDKAPWRYPERDAPPPSAPSPGKLPGFWMSRGRGVESAEAVPWTGEENLSAAGILDTIESVPSSGQGQESQVFTRDSARSSTVQSSTNATARSHAKLDAKQQGDVSVGVFEGGGFVAREDQESGLRGRGEASVQSRRSMYVERAIMGIERRRHCRMFRDWKQAVHPPPAQPRRQIAKIPDQDVETVKQNVFTGWRIQSVWSFYVDQAMAQVGLKALRVVFPLSCACVALGAHATQTCKLGYCSQVPTCCQTSFYLFLLFSLSIFPFFFRLHPYPPLPISVSLFNYMSIHTHAYIYTYTYTRANARMHTRWLIFSVADPPRGHGKVLRLLEEQVCAVSRSPTPPKGDLRQGALEMLAVLEAHCAAWHVHTPCDRKIRGGIQS